ncbi:dynamin family protein [Streptantibioticus rubrisoli]|uniref:Dynamin family protein n=1 Tax=Streptantibioticus rubrisoli TaxID=1387313 RepID=A0ABT1PD83_9ACTN|nr:dynamin family protein [Streptantibioticus rubrisoli]MCQ4043332.1 dynamin family protein [Streptantibioticus rubrisoli]
MDAEQDTPTVASDRADAAAPPERHGAAAPPPDPAGAVPGEDASAADAAAIPPAAGVPAGSCAVPLVDHVPDVTAETSGWLREARALAERAGLEEVVTVLDELSAGRGRPTFRIAVVGEFNRGKSTLLNTLLGRDLLPTGPLPVTRTQVAVRAGAEDALTVEWPDGRRETRRPDAPDAWHGLAFAPDEPDTVAGTTDRPGTADPAGSGAPTPGAPVVTLTAAGEWLRSLGAELLDTPGVNSGSAEQFEQVRKALAGSDAALFVVSALSPMGVTERHLLEGEVLCRHVVFAAVVVTMLDLLEPAEREAAMLDIQERLADLSAIRVLPAPAPGAAGPSVVRAAVEEFAATDQRGLWRDRRIAAQVADQCAALSRFAATALAAGRLSETEIEERRAAARSAAEAGERRWEQLRIDLTHRQLSVGATARDEIHKRRDDLVERLRWELERAQDPRLWWQRDLPVRLRRELALIAGECERTIALPALADDARWLDREIAALLPDAPAGSAPSELRLTAEPLISGEISDLGRTRLLNRLGAQGGAIVGYLVAAARSASMPMIYGAGFSILGGLIAEASIRSATEEQRREVHAVLVRVVGESIAAFQRQTAEVIAEVHGELFERLDRSRRAWQQAADPAAASAERPGTDWEDLARSAASLATRIRTAMHS